MAKQSLISLVFGLLGGLIFVISHNLVYSKTIAVVKVEEIISSHMKEFGGKNISDDERNRISEAFARSLDSVIKRLAEEENLTLLVAPAVVTYAPDYTDHIKAQIALEMGKR